MSGRDRVGGALVVVGVLFAVLGGMLIHLGVGLLVGGLLTTAFGVAIVRDGEG